MKQAGTVTAREWGVPGKADDALRWPEAFQETHGRPMSERARDRQGLRWRLQGGNVPNPGDWLLMNDVSSTAYRRHDARADR